MPTCPGCHGQLGYEELREHLALCETLQDDRPAREPESPEEVPDFASLEERLEAHERRIRTLEARLRQGEGE